MMREYVEFIAQNGDKHLNYGSTKIAYEQYFGKNPSISAVIETPRQLTNAFSEDPNGGHFSEDDIRLLERAIR